MIRYVFLALLAPSLAFAQSVPTFGRSGLSATGQHVITETDFANALRTKADSPQLDAEIDRARATEIAPFAFTGSPAARTAMARAAEVRSLLDWLLPADNGDAAAALTRLCQAVPGNLHVSMAGNWTWNSSVMACGRRSLAVVGNGPGVTVITAGTAGIMLDVAAPVGKRVTLRGMTILSSAPAGTQAVMRVSYPHVPSASLGSVVMEDVEIISPASGAVAGSICKGLMLDGAWQPKVARVVLTGRAAIPGDPGCALVDVSETIALSISHSQQYFGDALVYQSGYTEGLTFLDNSLVATNTWVRQNLDTIVRRAGLTMIGFWGTNNEISTQQSGLSLASAQNAMLVGQEYGTWGTGAWIAQDLTDVQGLTSSSELIVGGSNAATSNGVRVSRGSGAYSGNNTWSNLDIQGAVQGYAMIFGPNTDQNSAQGLRFEIGRAYVLDQGTNNTITYRALGGGLAHVGNASILGSTSQLLFGVDNIPNAANALVATASTAGSSPVLGARGPDANISVALQSKGIAPVILQTGNGTSLVARPDGSGAQVNYGVVVSGSGTNAVIYTGSPGANVVVVPGPGNGALGLSGIPTCPNATTGQLCSAGSGQPVLVK